MKGMKLWIMTLVEYSPGGQATILKSFVKPAKDSSITTKNKTNSYKKPVKAKQINEEELW